MPIRYEFKIDATYHDDSSIPIVHYVVPYPHPEGKWVEYDDITLEKQDFMDKAARRILPLLLTPGVVLDSGLSLHDLAYDHAEQLWEVRQTRTFKP